MTMSNSVDGLCLKFAIVSGTTADTDITLTGIATEDVIVSVISLEDNTTADPVDRTSVTSITAANVIQTSTATASEFLCVTWIDRSA